MKKRKKAWNAFAGCMAVCVGASGLLSGCSGLSEGLQAAMGTTEAEEEEKKDFSKIRAQDDFYGYVNAKSLLETEVNPKYGSADAFTELYANVEAEQKAALLEIANSEEEYEEGSSEYILQHAYRQYQKFLKDDSQKKKVSAELTSVIQDMQDAATVKDLLKVSQKAQTTYAAGGLMTVGVDTNYIDSTKYAVVAPQLMAVMGVSLEEIYKSYGKAEYIESQILETLHDMGYDDDTAEKLAKNVAVMAVEMSRETDYEVMNAASQADMFTFATTDELNKIWTNVSCEELETMNGIPSNPYGGWLIMDKGQMEYLNRFFTDENLETLKAWTICTFVSIYGEEICPDYPKMAYRYEDDARTEEEKIYSVIATRFVDEMSDIYADRAYTKEMDEKLNDMCDQVVQGYRDLITQADWLSEEGRAALQKKLDKLIFITGALPRKEVTEADKKVVGADFFETFKNGMKRDNEESISHIGQAVDREVAGMPMQMVNACYVPNNTVTITVAIMGAPFFDPKADEHANLGGLGMVVAHEVGHAFDSNCIQFDPDGVFDPDWIPAKDREILEERNKAAISYFEEYFTVFDVYRVDGTKTLGENYADLGGMECICSLCDSKEEYETMFTSFATIWSTLKTDTDVLRQLQNDVHSPETIRVNAVLASLDEFYETYDVKEGDGMYVAPENRISRWYDREVK